MTGEFVYDDLPAAVENPNARLPLRLRQILTEPYWGLRPGTEQISLIRPVVTFSFAVNEAVTGFVPTGYRAVNLFLHSVASCLVMLIASVVGVPLLWSFFAGVLFAVHPIHCEAIAATANRTEPMCAVFYLGSLLCYFLARSATKRETAIGMIIGSLALFSLSLGSKEVAITLPVVILAIELMMRYVRVPSPWGRGFLNPAATVGDEIGHLPTARTLRVPSPILPPLFGLGLVLILLLYFLYRSMVLTSPFSANVSPGDNPLIGSAGLERWATPFSQIALATELLLYPARLSVDYTAAVVPVVQTMADWSFLAGVGCLGIVVVGLIVAVRRKNIPIIVGLCLLGGSYALISNTVILATIFFAERVMYLPSAGFSIVSGALLASVRWNRSKLTTTLVGVVVVVALGVLAVRSWERNKDWQNDERLFSSSLFARPNSSRLHTNLGRLSMLNQNWELSVLHLDTALRIYPENAQALMLRGQLARRMSNSEAAIEYFDRANASLGGKHGRALAELCSIYSERKQTEQAGDVCRRAIRLRPDHPDTWTAFGDFANLQGDTGLADNSYRRALDLEPTNLHALNRLGRLLAETHKYGELLDIMFRILEQNQGNAALIRDIEGLTMKVVAEAVRTKDIGLARTILSRARDKLGNPERWNNMIGELP